MSTEKSKARAQRGADEATTITVDATVIDPTDVPTSVVNLCEDLWWSDKCTLISEALVKFGGMNITVEKKGLATIAVNKTSGAEVKRKYVKLDDIMNTVRPALAQVGCYVEQHLAGDGVVTRIVHRSGQFIASRVRYQVWNEGGDRINNLQKMGGGLTYLKRYALSAILNITADEDDDAGTGDNMGYKGSDQQAKPTQATSEYPDYTPKDTNKQWLNLRDKNGNLTQRGTATQGFINQGGALNDVFKKYRCNGTELQELIKWESEAKRAIAKAAEAPEAKTQAPVDEPPFADEPPAGLFADNNEPTNDGLF
jgi:hypothetical protein